MKHLHLLLERHFQGVTSENALNNQQPLNGTCSDGRQYHLNQDGSYTEPKSGTTGSLQELMGDLFPHLTPEGIQTAIKKEASEVDWLKKHVVDSQIDLFRADSRRVEELSLLTGIEQQVIESVPVWLDPDWQTIHYVQQSWVGHPLSHTSWSEGSRQDNHVGVPRPKDLSGSGRVWFTENPLDAAALQETLGEPVLARPNQQLLDWVRYADLLEEKQVIVLMGEARGDWKNSWFPFTQQLIKAGIHVEGLRTYPFTAGDTLMKWISDTPDPKQMLLDQVHAIESTSGYDQKTYHEFIDTTGMQSIRGPQDFKNGAFWYGCNDGKVVSSSPCNILNDEQLKQIHELILQDPVYAGVRLDKPMAFNVITAPTELSPPHMFGQIRKALKKFVYLEHQETFTLITLWVMGTYVYRLFPAYGYLHFLGSRNSGKTTTMEFIARASFNGFMESQSTRASLALHLHQTGGTACLDEFESSSIGTSDQYEQLLNAGYKQGGSYKKMKGSDSVNLNVYSPKVLASIEDIENDALKSRTITVQSVFKPTGVELQDYDSDYGPIHKLMRVLRHGGYALGLHYHQPIYRQYRRLPRSIGLPSGMSLSNRRRQLTSPLLAIAQFVDTNGNLDAEDQLLVALDYIWNPDYKQQNKLERLLEEQLQAWATDSAFTSWTHKNDKLWIHNDCWETTDLCAELGGKDSVLQWLGTLSGVQKKPVYVNSELETKSCTGLPVDLKIHKKTVTEIFSQNPGF